jgi:glycosyltransferase involved in cell wall biosynthesis
MASPVDSSGLVYCRVMLSVIVPIYNEEENIPPLHDELRQVLEALGQPYEIVYVDDGSSDGSFQLLQAVAEADPQVQVVRFRRNFGQTAALAAGIDASIGEILVFMDGDRQNDPHAIPSMLGKLDEGYDVVSGWRKNRHDAALTRKLPSRLANLLISAVSGVHLNDYGCTLKVYRREVIGDVRLYGEMHRFIPAYAAWYGARIAEMPVNHRPRVAGSSKYGLSRTMKVLLDLLTLKFLSDYSTKPIYLFGGLGATCLLAGGGAMLLALYQLIFEDVKAHRNPVVLIAVFFLLSGLIFVTQGLLAELQTRTYHESQHKRTYVVRAHLRGGQEVRVRRNGLVGDGADTAIPARQPEQVGRT